MGVIAFELSHVYSPLSVVRLKRLDQYAVYSRGSVLRQAAQRLQNLSVIRKAARAVLGVDQRPIGSYIEDAAAAFDELRLYAQLLGNFGRQTGGPRQIVSAYAVLDRDAHVGLPEVFMIAEVRWGGSDPVPHHCFARPRSVSDARNRFSSF